MIKATPQELWNVLYLQQDTFEEFCDEVLEGTTLTPDSWKAIKDFQDAKDISIICVSAEMSADHIGGDDVVSIVRQTIQAIKDGFEVLAWYGSESEVLVLGYKKDILEVLDLEIKD